MSKTITVTKITEIVTQTAPELRFAAAYNVDDPQLAGSIKLYQDRCFVYVLTLRFKEREECVYVGETRFQYARFLQHKANIAFDRIYLYECEESVLRMELSFGNPEFFWFFWFFGSIKFDFYSVMWYSVHAFYLISGTIPSRKLQGRSELHPCNSWGKTNRRKEGIL